MIKYKELFCLSYVYMLHCFYLQPRTILQIMSYENSVVNLIQIKLDNMH